MTTYYLLAIIIHGHYYPGPLFVDGGECVSQGLNISMQWQQRGHTEDRQIWCLQSGPSNQPAMGLRVFPNNFPGGNFPKPEVLPWNGNPKAQWLETTPLEAM